jgi:hypothetical protein
MSHQERHATPQGSAFASPAPARRLLSLDVFRGLVIASMVLVNNHGNSSYCSGGAF